MNRIIKFRGQIVNNKKWVYGMLIHSFEGTHIVASEYFKPSNEQSPILTEVIPSTVGQFTGLKDKNGVDIYEGDIYHHGDSNITYTVLWHDTGFKGEQNSSTSYVGLEYWKNRIVVICNIHNK